MTGMDTLIDLRCAGLKPGMVFVYLVPKHSAEDAKYALSSYGNVAVNVADSESLSDLDFRPLHGLQVCLTDHADNPTRQYEVARRIASVKPSLLAMPIAHPDGDFTIYPVVEAA